MKRWQSLSLLNSHVWSWVRWFAGGSFPIPFLTRTPAAYVAGVCPASAVAAAAGKQMEYFYRHLYLPQLGMFSVLPQDLQLGHYRKEPAQPVALGFTDEGGFIKDGVEYRCVWGGGGGG